MDDDEVFASILDRLPFCEAIARGPLLDYRSAAVLGVSDDVFRGGNGRRRC